MKKITSICWMLLLLLSLSSFQHTQSQTLSYSKTQIERFVREVFANHADELVLQSPTSRLQLIQDFLSRVQITNQPGYTGKKFTLLSTIALQNKYNPNLSRDAFYDPVTFNPLKYNFPMASRSKEIFRFDHTDYLITIEPIK